MLRRLDSVRPIFVRHTWPCRIRLTYSPHSVGSSSNFYAPAACWELEALSSQVIRVCAFVCLRVCLSVCLWVRFYIYASKRNKDISVNQAVSIVSDPTLWHYAGTVCITRFHYVCSISCFIIPHCFIAYYTICMYRTWLVGTTCKSSYLDTITALHGMQTRSSDENSVCPSVRPSVRLSHAWIVTKRWKDLSTFLYHTKYHLA